jgi:DNA mismatch repair protein MutS
MSSESLETKTSPMMAQWHACKKAAKDAILLFRMGDFYESFYDDAALISRELDVVLTKRQGIPMCGVPHHTYESYLDRLISKGYRVAVAEQMEDPKKTKGLVKREVVRVVTPGTVISSSLLPANTHNFFIAIAQVNMLYGVSILDITTGELQTTELDQEKDLINEIYRLRPTEILISEKFHQKSGSLIQEMRQSYNPLISVIEEWRFDHRLTYDFLTSHFKVQSLDGYGLKGKVAAINATGALLAHVKDTLCHSVDHIQQIEAYSTADYMSLDNTTQINLELAENKSDSSRKNTLLEILDKTQTPMGGRLLLLWLKRPLLSVEEIQKRYDGIEALLSERSLTENLSQLLVEIRDLERLMMKISTAFATPRDVLALACSFRPIPEIQLALKPLRQSSLLTEIANHVHHLPEMTSLIFQALVDEPPTRLGEGKTFREGYNEELDELRSLSRDGKSWLAQYQNQLRESTGIKTLKVGYTKMFGYYIEVSRGQASKMPESFQRRQTLVNAERYITQELKDYETKVLTAEERIGELENELFQDLRSKIIPYASQILKIAHYLAKLDCLNSLAETARRNHYIRPRIDESQILQITEGRHPVIEASHLSERFIPNDTLLDNQKNRMAIITGPNMAGKSTYIRQVALITIMAQIGSFVPAKDVHIGIVDKVFTRIGASDDLSRGQSTFMVEMSETANILNNATSRSLVILDEIGRGTSTYDGISIAWAVAEYLLTAENKNPKTLFATHYWELTKLEEKLPGAVNYNVAVSESQDHIVFLRKIIKGGTDRSYGIHVARLAGMPQWVLSRAKEILVHLEENANRKSAFEPQKSQKLPTRKSKQVNEELQLFLFGK